MSSPTFTIVVPVYNGESFIARCLDSLLAQTCPASEILVFDDGSADATAEIVDSYSRRDGRVRCIRQTNIGSGATRNRSIAEASGDFVLWVDADDTVDATLLEKCVAVIDEDTDFVFFRFSWWGKDGIRTPRSMVESLAGRTELRGTETELLLQNRWFSVWQAAYRRDFLVKHGIRNGEGYVFEDQEFMVAAALAARRIAIIDEALYFYFINLDSQLRDETIAAHAKRLDDRGRAMDAVAAVLERHAASDRAKAFLVEHELEDLAYQFRDSWVTLADRRSSVAALARFLDRLRIGDPGFLKEDVAGLYASGDLRRDPHLAVADLMYRRSAWERAAVAGSLAYRATRKYERVMKRAVAR